MGRVEEEIIMEYILGIVFVAAILYAAANSNSQPTQRQENNQWLVLVVLVIIAVIGVSMVGG